MATLTSTTTMAAAASYITRSTASAASSASASSSNNRVDYHEFIITYEGPVHPSASNSNSNQKTFCLSLPPSGIDPRSGSSFVSNNDLLASLSLKVGWPSFVLCVAKSGRSTRCSASVCSSSSNTNKDADADYDDHNNDQFLIGNLFPTHSLQNNVHTQIIHHQHPPYTLQIHPRHTLLLGGKGGFGTLLKGQSKQAGARTTLDFGACRDLSGRRLRHVNDEIKLRKFRELQTKREKGQSVDELAALQTPSGIRNWHLMVPTWSEGATQTNKGRRKIERQYAREVRQYKSREERVGHEREVKRLEEEWAVMEYVKRGEREGDRVSEKGVDVKEGILEHLRKRKLEKQRKEREKRPYSEEGDLAFTSTLSAAAAKTIESDISASLEDSTASHNLMTLSGEISTFETMDKDTPPSSSYKLRLQSQSDFATAVVLLDTSQLLQLNDTKEGGSSSRQGIYIEYTIQSGGLAQIGWIRSPDSKGSTSSASALTFLPNSDTGDGVGDDSFSFGYDGSRGLKFHNGSEVVYGEESNEEGKKKKKTGVVAMEWKCGDVLGCWCKRTSASKDDNTKNGGVGVIEIGYVLNGQDLGVAFSVPATTSNNGNDVFGYYPAVSLNLNEVVDLNVGPVFAHDVKDGCVGACELVKVVVEDEDGDAVVDSAVTDEKDAATQANGEDAPPRKRPREEDGKKEATKEDNTHSSQQNVEEESFDLDKCNSVEEVKAMGPDRLKNILLSMGVKCGGTPDDRANRLFSLKGLPRSEYPNKVRGKNFVL